MTTGEIAAEWLDDFAAYLRLGVIGGLIFVACFNPAGVAMILRWVLS